MGVLLDIEDGGELVSTLTERSVIRIADVDQLQGSTPHAMQWDALVTLSTLGAPQGGPIIHGSPHPSVPLVVVTGFRVVPTKTEARMRVDITYGIPRFDVPSGAPADGVDHKTVRQMGRPIQVTRDPKDGTTELTVDPPAIYAPRGPQTKTVTVNKSLGVVVFNRTEPTVPTLRMRTFQNKVNSVALGTGGLYPAKSVYCNIIQADTADQGGLYVVRYEFLHDEDEHEIEYKWERPPLEVDVYTAASRKRLDPYVAIDFNALGFNWDD